jgi:hypothetical protein
MTVDRHPSSTAGGTSSFESWGGVCGLPHEQDVHCPNCIGDHSTGFCTTPDAVAELSKVDVADMRQRVEQAAAGMLRVRDGA